MRISCCTTHMSVIRTEAKRHLIQVLSWPCKHHACSVVIQYLCLPDTRRDLCFMQYRQNQCSSPSRMLVTKSMCCCSVDSMDAPGIAWGRECEPCPSMSDPNFKILCPHGPGIDHNGGGTRGFCTTPCTIYRIYNELSFENNVHQISGGARGREV